MRIPLMTISVFLAVAVFQPGCSSYMSGGETLVAVREQPRPACLAPRHVHTGSLA